MYYITNLTLTFNTKAAANRAKKIAKEAILSLESSRYSDGAEYTAAHLIEENNTLLIPEGEVAYSTEEWMENVLPVLLKAIAKQLPHESFTFESNSTNDYSDAELDGRYAKGILEINSTYYPEGYCESVSCPECGEYVVRLDEYDPSKTYICPECGEEVDLSENYKACAPVIEHKAIIIK